VAIPAGWTDPQINDSLLTAGFIKVTPGTGTALDATPLDILGLDTVRVNINAMGQGKTFAIQYGGNAAAAYAKITGAASCGLNTFGTQLNGTVSLSPPSIRVRETPIFVTGTDTGPDSAFIGTTGVYLMDLNFDNTTGLKTKEIKSITLRTENGSGTARRADSLLTNITIKDADLTYASATPGASADVALSLSTRISVGTGITKTVKIYGDIKNDTAGLKNKGLRIKVADSTKIKAVESTSQDSVTVRTTASFPLVSDSTRLIKPLVKADSLLVTTLDVIPSTLGKLEKGITGLRMIFRNLTPVGANDVAIKGLAFTVTGPANPSVVVAKKILQRKGGSILNSSSTIETSGSTISFDLTITPINIQRGVLDTIDLLFDVVSAPSGTVKFTLAAAGAVTAKDAPSGTATTVKGVFPQPAGGVAAAFSVFPNTPSGRTADGVRAEWSVAGDWLDSAKLTGGVRDSIFVTWDNTNIYFTWSGRDLSTNGDLFIYMNTGAGGSNSTWNYASQGTHTISTLFGGANYLFYYDNGSAKGLQNGASGYSNATFTGEVAATGAVTEIRLPRANIGNPASLKFFAFVQMEATSEIVAALPFGRVGQFVRNPIGIAPQNFISWMRIASFASGSTPRSQVVMDSSGVTKPVYSYSTGSDPVTGLTVGYDRIYISVGGAANPGVVALDTAGALQWRFTAAAAATPVTTFWNGTYDIVCFGAGTRLVVLEDQLASANPLVNLDLASGTVGTPIYSGISTDSNLYLVTSTSGTLHRRYYRTGAPGWTKALSGNYQAGLTSRNKYIYVPCTNGYLKMYDTAGTRIDSMLLGAAINEDLFMSSSEATVFAATNDNNLWARRAATIAAKWSINLGAVIQTAPFCDINDTAAIYIGVGSNLKRVRDLGASASPAWTYVATDLVSANPVSWSGRVLFGSDDKRLFAIDTAGANRPGWPSTPLSGKTNCRVAVDGFYNFIYYGTADGQVYRFNLP
jgi:hypothetical protein